MNQKLGDVLVQQEAPPRLRALVRLGQLLLQLPIKLFSFLEAFFHGEKLCLKSHGCGSVSPVGKALERVPVLNLNDVESVGLLLLVLYSAGLSAMELPLNESQALGMSLAVFVWLGVLLVLILARLWARKMARKTKVTVKRMSRGASARSTGTLDGGVLPSSSRSQRMQLKAGGEATEVEMASQLGSRDGGGGDEEEAVE